MTRPAAAAVIVPIRGFEGGKQRLGPPLDAGQRAALLRSMAERVVLAAGPLPVAVVSGAREVRAWAASFGLVLLDDPGSLNQAAVTGVRWAASQGIARAVVAHADLPLATTLGPLARDGSRPIVAAVPCHRDDGTPVLSIPTESSFAFAYGPGSFRRHAAEARRLRLGFRVVRDPSLARDLDIPADMAGLPLLGEPGGPERASALG